MVESQPRKTANPDALYKRVLVVFILLPIGFLANYLGGWVYSLLFTLVVSIAAYEYAVLFQAGELRPSVALIVGVTAVLVMGRTLYSIEQGAVAMVVGVLLAMTYHLIEFERGREQAGTDFAVTVSGIVYMGWLGAYLVSLRNLADGFWWVMIVLPAIWLADTGAYLVGVRIGKHKMTPRLSPKKSWEGYLAGILIAVPGTALLALTWQFLGAGSSVTPLRGALLALVLSVLTIFGDLGESMIKRQVGVKDSSHILPGHGGIFDRIDSWLWGGVIGYYVITLFFL
jgi:phosphatidate cytidylyltransferase